MSAAAGRPARRKDSVFPQQSWNSSQTRTGFLAFSSAPAIRGANAAGSASADAIAEQNPMKSRRERPRSAHASVNQVEDLPTATPWVDGLTQRVSYGGRQSQPMGEH